METLRVDALAIAPPLESSAARFTPSPRTTAGAPKGADAPTGPETARRPVRDAADSAAVPEGSADARRPAKTEEQSALLRGVAEELQSEISSLGKHSLKITYAEDADRFVVAVVDSETQEVIRQIPPESLLEARRQMEELRGLLFDDRS